MSSKKIIVRFSKIDFSSNDTYSCSKLKLVDLHKLIRATEDQDVIQGIFNKILDCFINKNKFIKSICIKIFKDIKNKIRVMDNLKIIRMFYQNDPEINILILKFVKIFHKFFVNDDIILYYVINSKCKYKNRVLEKFTFKNQDCKNQDCKKVDCKNQDCKNQDCKKVDCKNQDCKNQDCKKEDCKKEDFTLEKGMKYLYLKKKEKCLKIFNNILKQEIDYKFKIVIGHFVNKINREKEGKFTFEIKDPKVDESLVCKINGFSACKLYKKLKKCYDHYRKK